MRNLCAAVFALSLICPAAANAGSFLASWIQLAPGGGAEARVVTDKPNCPSVSGPNGFVPMTERAAPNGDFGVRVCSYAAPVDGGRLSIVFEPPMDPAKAGEPTNMLMEGVRLPAVTSHPQRIMVFGDTGCRIKGAAVQACNDPKAWPFAQIAAQAAALKPDLVVHVGDYLYRESPCPAGNAGCAGSPYGDNWDTWNADFYAPAAPLLNAAPWVFVRGNHEDCVRSGPGWLRLLGPIAFDPAAPCAPHLAPYAVPLGDMNLVVMDNASAPDTSVDHDLLASYQSDFAGLPSLANAPVWAVMHRPIWGAIAGPANIPLGGNATLIAAIGNTHPLGNVSLMLAGHIHTFEVMNYAKGTPPAMVAGFGGDNLDVTPMNLSGANLSGQYVQDGFSLPGFGFLLMTREDKGWRIDVHKVDGSIEEVCHFAAGRIDCAGHHA
jgi:Calcineurin-like phosphoesterase